MPLLQLLQLFTLAEQRKNPTTMMMLMPPSQRCPGRPNPNLGLRIPSNTAEKSIKHETNQNEVLQCDDDDAMMPMEMMD